MKQLPIKLKPAITSECWTYNRTCIIETDPSGPEWIASHYSVFMHWNGQMHFGDGMDTYSMSYYDDILEHQCVPLEQYSAGELIQRFEQWIDEGYYIIVDMNLGDLIRGYRDFKVHEILLYGYDERRRVFYSPLQNEKTGQFESFELEYDVIPPAIESVIVYYRQKPVDHFWRFYSFFYPLTKLKIRQTYNDDNMFILKALKKLEVGYNSYCHEISIYKQMRELHDKFINYTGLGCLLGMREILSAMIEGAETTLPNDPYSNVDKVNNLFKLYEHRCIMRSMLKLLREKLDIDNEAYQSAFETYCSGIANMRESYLLMGKAQISGKLNALPGIIRRLDAIYENDYDSLRIMDSIAREKMSERL